MTWFLLALLSAISLATADAFTKKLYPDQAGSELLVIRFTLPAVVLAPIVFFLPYSQLDSTFWLLMALLVPLEVAAMYLYLVAVRDSSLALTLPYLAFTPVFNILTGWLFLGETVSISGATGVFLITLGAYLINLKPEHFGDIRVLVKPFVAIIRNRSSLIMLIVATIYSVTSVLSKRAMQGVRPEIFGMFYYFAVGSGALILARLLGPTSFAVLRSRRLHYLFIGAMMITMVITHFLSIAQVEVAYMIAVKRTSLLFGLLYGYLLFHDTDIRKNLFAGMMMVAGVAIIVLT